MLRQRFVLLQLLGRLADRVLHQHGEQIIRVCHGLSEQLVRPIVDGQKNKGLGHTGNMEVVYPTITKLIVMINLSCISLLNAGWRGTFKKK